MYLNREEYEDSISWYRKAVDAQPSDPDLRYNLALGYIQTGAQSDAVAALESLIKLKADYWDAYYHLAKLQFAAGDKNAASRTVDSLVRGNPGYPKRSELEELVR